MCWKGFASVSAEGDWDALNVELSKDGKDGTGIDRDHPARGPTTARRAVTIGR